MLEFSFLTDPHLWELLGPSLVAKGSSSKSTSQTHVTTSTSFNPVITIGRELASAGDPTPTDTGSTFAKELLAAPVPLKFEADPGHMDPAGGKEPVSTPLMLATIGLMFWKLRSRR